MSVYAVNRVFPHGEYRYSADRRSQPMELVWYYTLIHCKHSNPQRTPTVTDAQASTSIAFNSARFLTSASVLAECPPDTGSEVAFSGRSNAGKSSALNTITRNGKLARTSKTPGRTRLINFFTLSRPNTRLVDLPGYGYARVDKETQAQWQKHLDDYMQHRESLRGMTLIMDIRHPLTEFDQMMIDWCEHSELPMLILLTKADKLKQGAMKQQVQKVRNALADTQCVQRVVAFSSTKQTGVDEARAHLSQWLMAAPLVEEEDLDENA